MRLDAVATSIGKVGTLVAFIVFVVLFIRDAVSGSGAWYNSNKGVAAPLAEYNATLAQLVSFLEGLPAPPHVLWLGLPPMSDDLYGHDLFADFDALAARALASSTRLRSSFVDLAAATQARKGADPGITSDGLHWCNFGATSVPKWLVRRLLLLLLHITAPAVGG